MKGAATVAAAGGIIATVAGPASAETVSRPHTGAVEQAALPSTIGPKSAPVEATNALAAIGYAAPKAPAKPQVIEDLVVKEQRAEAAAKAQAAAQAKAAAEAKAAAQARAAASRSTTRTSLTASTYSAKVGTNASLGSTSAPAASSGVRSSHNWATAGQCTWGALNKWYQSEGYYPGGWTGNALVWASGAASAGYTVSSVPRVRSIVVLQPGVYGSSSAGHVAWVTAVNGDQVTIVEMNALAGPYNYNTRTLTNVGSMKYIYAT
jgi:surface antigen